MPNTFKYETMLTIDAYLDTFDEKSKPHRNTVYNWIRAGRLKTVRPGGKNGKLYIIIENHLTTDEQENVNKIASSF